MYVSTVKTILSDLLSVQYAHTSDLVTAVVFLLLFFCVCVSAKYSATSILECWIIVRNVVRKVPVKNLKVL